MQNSKEWEYNKKGQKYLFVDICEEAALLGAQYGIDEEYNVNLGRKDAKGLAEGVILSNRVSFAKRVLDKLENMCPMNGLQEKENSELINALKEIEEDKK